MTKIKDMTASQRKAVCMILLENCKCLLENCANSAELADGASIVTDLKPLADAIAEAIAQCEKARAKVAKTL